MQRAHDFPILEMCLSEIVPVKVRSAYASKLVNRCTEQGLVSELRGSNSRRAGCQGGVSTAAVALMAKSRVGTAGHQPVRPNWWASSSLCTFSGSYGSSKRAPMPRR